jgi:zinc resistance-associated protein
MKKLSIVGLVVAVGLLLGTVAYGGWGGCGPWAGGQVDVSKVKAFQKETLPLRDEMITKRLDLRNEYAKETPDQGRVVALEKDIIDLRAKIQGAAQKQGLPAWGQGYGPGGGGGGRGPGMMGRGGYGPGYGRGSGCGSCPMWQ